MIIANFIHDFVKFIIFLMPYIFGLLLVVVLVAVFLRFFKRVTDFENQEQAVLEETQEEANQKSQHGKSTKNQEQINDKVKSRLSQERYIPTEIKIRVRDKEQGTAEAGDKGEEALTNAFKLHGRFGDCYWWVNKRVKNQIGEAGPNEIDLIVVSHTCIYVFESKYYRGTLIGNPNKWDKKNPWIIVKPKRNSELKFVNDDTEIETVENFLEILQVKVEKLKQRLSEKGIIISPDSFKANVVFTHKGIKFDPSVTQEGLISINDIQSYLDDAEYIKLSDSERFIIALIRKVIQNEGKSTFELKIPTVDLNHLLTSNYQLLELINSLPSWDSIIFYGGKVIKGDVLSIGGIFEGQGDLRFLNEECDIFVDCKRTSEEIRSDWDKGKHQILEVRFPEKEPDVKAKTIAWCKLNYENPKIRFQGAGQKVPVDFSIYEIERIALRGLYRLGNEKTSRPS